MKLCPPVVLVLILEASSAAWAQDAGADAAGSQDAGSDSGGPDRTGPPPPPPPPPLPPAAPATAPVVVVPAVVERGPQTFSDDSASSLMPESSDDAFGTESATLFGMRTLTQIRYRRTWLDAGSLARLGEIDPLTGLPLTIGEAERRVLYQSLTGHRTDGYDINRAFLRLTARPTKHVRSKLLLDFAELLHDKPQKSLKLAYVEAEPIKRVELTFGLFKRRFSLLELLPIADFELAEVGPTDEFIKDIGWGGRDIGAMVAVAPLQKKRWLRMFLASFAGDTLEGYDATPWKLVTARIETEPVKDHLRIGADFAWRPSVVRSFKYKDDPTSAHALLDKGQAASADVIVLARGFEMRAEAMGGTRPDLTFRQNAHTFVAGWVIATYRFPIRQMLVFPALRAEWLDTDYGHALGGRFFGSAALNVDFTRNLRMLIDLSVYGAQRGTPALNNVPSAPDEVRAYDMRWMSLTTQLQIVI